MKIIALIAALFATPALATTTITFDSPTPAGFTIAGGQIRSGNNPNQAVQPGGGSGNYLAAQPGNPAIITADRLYKNISFDWGSVDRFNTIDFLNANGAVIRSVQGTGPNGQVSYRASFALDDGFRSIRFSSSLPALEVDNVTFSGAVPEPATWAMMLAGFGLVGAAARRRKTLVLA